MGLQSHGNPNFEIFGSPNLGILGQNDIWVKSPWPSAKNTIREKVVASSNPNCGETWKSMFVCGSSMHQKCSNYALTNLLFGLCKFVWIIDPLVTLLSPYLGALAHPSTFEMLRIRERIPTPCLSIIFTFRHAIESIKVFGGASIQISW